MKCRKYPRIFVAEPKMATYLRVSTEITRLFERYVPKEAIHVYSVDESFIKVDGALKLWGDALESRKKSARIKTGIPATLCDWHRTEYADSETRPGSGSEA